MPKNSKHCSLSGNKQVMYVDALPQDMIKWTTIIILSDRCANFFYQQICYLNLDLFSKPCYCISMIFRLYILATKTIFLTSVFVCHTINRTILLSD